ncbi:predicted protein, partial [Nematostella vectensis]
MQNGDIPSSNISALTWSENPPWNGRLMMSNYWYAPRSPNFLLVDLGLYGAVITAVASQGYESRAVRGYSLHFSTDGVMWVHYTQFGQKKVYHLKLHGPDVVWLLHPLVNTMELWWRYNDTKNGQIVPCTKEQIKEAAKGAFIFERVLMRNDGVRTDAGM